MKKRMNMKSVKGQAIAEALISFAMLSSVLLASASLYQIMQADITANKAARVAAWHGTLYQGLTPAQIDQKYRANIGETLMNRTINDANDFSGDPLVGGQADLAFSQSNTSPTYIYPSNRSSGLASTAGLNQNQISSVSISIPLKAEAEIFKVTEPISYVLNDLDDEPLPFDAIAQTYQFHVKGKGTLLSNGFVPLNEEGFHQAISNIAADGQPMTYFEVWRTPMRTALGLRELDEAIGPNGLSTVATDQSRVLPSQLGTFVE